jgi:hypothetical protein
MSNIGDFYALLGAATVTFTGQDGTAYSLTAKYDGNLRSSVQASALPVRLLLPYSDRDVMAASVTEFHIGNTAPIAWTIIDQLIWQQFPAGRLEDSAKDLREYVSAYFTAVLALDASSITDRMETQSVQVILRDDINFPRGSTSFYIGADVTWTVIEDDPL